VLRRRLCGQGAGLGHRGKPAWRREAADELVADTLDQLRAMLPVGLTRGKPTELMPPEVVEVWD
jgi:hypothetical protein